MKFIRKASAVWEGTGKDGSGTVSTQSTVLNETPYSYKTRFEEGIGTNPEELIGAAHAGCFTMQLSFLISEKGFTPSRLHTDARVFFEDGAIPRIELNLSGEVPEMDAQEFQKLAEKAKDMCPISKLLNAEIELKANFAQ